MEGQGWQVACEVGTCERTSLYFPFLRNVENDADPVFCYYWLLMELQNCIVVLLEEELAWGASSCSECYDCRESYSVTQNRGPSCAVSSTIDCKGLMSRFPCFLVAHTCNSFVYAFAGQDISNKAHQRLFSLHKRQRCI